MIRRTKNSVIKMTLGCSILAAIFFSNGVGAFAENLNDVQVLDLQQVHDEMQDNQDNNKFLIDAPIKDYYDITQVQKHAGFYFKLPSDLESSKWVDSVNKYRMEKLNDNSNAVVMKYDFNNETSIKRDRHQSGMKLLMFKGNSSDVIQQIDHLEEQEYSALPSIDYVYDFKENEKTYGNINGKELLVTRIYPHNNGGGSVRKSKYFIWQDDCVCYALNYDCQSFYVKDINSIPNNALTTCTVFMNEDEVNKVVNSFKDVESISEVEYKNTQADYSKVCHIYDKDDLMEANKLLKFKAKLPLQFTNGNVQIKNASVGCTHEEDKNDWNYNLTLHYNNDIEEITYTQNMYDSYKYDECEKSSTMLEKGYVVTAEDEYRVIPTIESYYVDGIKVYKYILSATDGYYYIYYSWKDNDVYNNLEIKYTLGYEDEIANTFITCKPTEQ